MAVDDTPAPVAEQKRIARDLKPIKVDARTAELLRIGVPTDEEFTASLNGDADPYTLREEIDWGKTLENDRQREKLFAVAPELADDLERLWQRGSAFLAETTYVYADEAGVPPFHDGPGTLPPRDAFWSLAQPLLALGRTYRADLAWLLRWSPVVGGSFAIGTAAALAIDDGDTRVAAALDELIDGSADVDGWSSAIPSALFRQADPASWARGHELLLAAGSQEGARQAIASAAGDASADAFIATLDVIAEHELYRFASITLLLGRWFGRKLRAADREATGGLLGAMLALLHDADVRAETLADDSSSMVLAALWAIGVRSISESVAEAAAILASDPSVERRAGAFAHVRRCPDRPDVRAATTIALRDADLRIASFAVSEVAWWTDDRTPDAEDALGELLERAPAKPQTLPSVGPLGAGEFSRSEVASALLRRDDPKYLDAVVAHLDVLGADTRSALVSGHGERLAKEHRPLLLRLVGDTSTWVRSSAFDAVKPLTLTDDEAVELEGFLTRKAGDLRQHVLELLEQRGPEAAQASAARLAASRNAQQRLAGEDLQARLGAVEEPTEHDGFGLVDLDRLAPPITPEDRGTAIAGPDVQGILEGLDAFVEARKTLEVTLEPAAPEEGDPEPTTTTLADLQAYQLHDDRLPAELDRELRALVEQLAREHGTGDLRSVLLARAAKTVEIAARDPWNRRKADDPWDARTLGSPSAAPGRSVLGRLGRRREPVRLALTHGTAVHALLDALAREIRDHAAIDWMLDATEALLAVPGADHEAASRGTHSDYHWQIDDVRRWFLAAPSSFTDAQARRLWGLARWVMDVAAPITEADLDEWSRGHDRRSPRIPRRLGSDLVCAAFDRGAATEDDVLDELIGPRGVHQDWKALARHSGPRSTDPWERDASDAVRALAKRARDRIVEVELQRGEATTPATTPAKRLRESGGAAVLAAAVKGLGKTTLQRGYSHEGATRKVAFSHLIRTAVPGDEDTREAFAQLVDGVPRGRLLEVACYAPQWAAHVEAVLGRQGLEDAVWWVHAHTKDSQWDVPDALRERWQREISRRTELSDEDLTDGAVDVEWFARVRETIGAAGLKEVLGAAKFASSSGGHKRAELFALALEGKVPLKDLRTRIVDKRHQDAVRALGLRPLSDKRRDADLRERYELIQTFLRESKQFGSQRQESERRAVEIGLANLARTAGFRDPLRLAWAMEAASTADLAAGVEVVQGDVVVRLGVDADGRPDLTVRRGEKALKAVPAPLRKDAAIVALNERKTALRRIQGRVRDGLETAMVRGDALSGAELLDLRKHVVLWPQLRRLVLAIDDGADGDSASDDRRRIGFPSDDATSLVDVDGATHPIDRETALRIAHPVDLLADGRWGSWQRHVLARELRQPFKQVFRELYRPIPAEQVDGTVGASHRYAGHQVRPAQAQRLLTGRGWTVESWMPPTRALRHENLLVEVDVELGWGTAAEVEPPTVEHVRFRRLAGGSTPVPLDEVPPRAFSEVMRDLDLVVSVAHAAGVDPEPSLSTIDARAALVRETAALLSLDGVDVEARRAVIAGKLGTYAVHLGSAQITRLPGGSVCVVPVGAQHRGRLFLPFADDDPRSAEVLAKVLLLAQDDQIRDPSILEQLR